MVYIERWEGKITEVREAPLSPARDALARLKLALSRWHLPGGYSFKLAALPDRGEFTPHQVIFADFKASTKPEIDSLGCRACVNSLRWKPGSYSFTEGPITYTVPELGWWKCPDGHPGKVDMEDMDRYVEVGNRFKQHLKNRYGSYDAKYGKIIPKGNN